MSFNTATSGTEGLAYVDAKAYASREWRTEPRSKQGSPLGPGCSWTQAQALAYSQERHLTFRAETSPCVTVLHPPGHSKCSYNGQTYSTHLCWLQPWTRSLPLGKTRSSYLTLPLNLSSLPCSRDSSRNLKDEEKGSRCQDHLSANGWWEPGRRAPFGKPLLLSEDRGASV